ncbi:C13 family peptidase [Alloalcanivorax gelatiniphagus]|uniref:Peptidase C13 n=1 Tax=Alloalcanivorax gelatiniphagus TaxID=1194167 RepID=A0ABY2XH90_9GAMM|nr:C13 family peptidase [Alloalcanivorax gelatiniphagus]TMW10581.1 hypothetical protein FGS76_18800 [Alloalcanivorax gelatiniphagus]
MPRPLLAALLCYGAVLLAACGPEQLPGDYRLPDGAVYDGERRDQLFHGQGTLTWPNGRRYQGQFVDGLMQGDGRLKDPDGCVYEGQFVAGLPEGEGRYVCQGMVYQGTFAGGEPVQGRVEYDQGDIYQGALRHWQPHGEGTWTGAEGGVYRGTFADGEIVQGDYLYDGERVYHGGFQDGFFQGEGELFLADGERRRGHFQQGVLDGPGRRITVNADGKETTEQGFFSHGEFFSEPDGYQQRRRQRAEHVEQRLYSEERRLQRALTALLPQKRGQRDIYVLLVGGDGRQTVFTREVQWVAERLGAHWDPRGHLLTLANGDHGGLPLATRTSVHEALTALDSIADPREDLIFVHLVSHGGRDGELVLNQPGLRLNDLTPADLHGWLDAMRPRYLWLVVSACYSGQWIEPLADRRRLIFTAAAGDRTSFGCGDDSERTWFSEALYGEALDSQGLDDPAALFEAARARVEAMETEQGIEDGQRSRPRMSLGPAFLDWW